MRALGVVIVDPAGEDRAGLATVFGLTPWRATSALRLASLCCIARWTATVVVNLTHSASFHSREKTAPSNPGTKNLKGAERIAAKWADHRKVPPISVRPNWTRHARTAPFKRNDTMLEVLPIWVIALPGTGIQDNLTDKAKKFGIPVWKFGIRSA